MEIGAIALDLITNLLAGVIQEVAGYKLLPFFERRRVERRIEDATAEAVEPLLPLLTQEHIPQDVQVRLLETCVEELRPLTLTPQRFFQGSLDGQKIFDEMYANRDLPQVVIEDGVKDVYALLCPRIATLLCKLPEAVKGWENEAWSENYRRLDEVTAQLRKVFGIVDALANAPANEADETLALARRSLTQRVRLQLDLTGLRADRPLEGKFDDFFVHPAFTEQVDVSRQRQPLQVQTPEDSFIHFLRPGSHTIVVGGAGAGKSTWTRWLQREALTNRWTGLCVRVELRSLNTEAPPSIHDLIRDAAGKHLAEDITVERIAHWLNRKKVLFLLDGFDEIRPADRDKIYEWIVNLKSATRGCPVVLTSRPLTTDHLNALAAEGWQEWMVEAFDEPRIIDYIERWYAHIPLQVDGDVGVDAAALASEWRNEPTIGPLTGNPLLLATLLMVHHLDGSLPSGRSELYRRYVEGMLGLWDDRRQVEATSVQLTLEQKRRIVRALALKLFLGEQEQIEEPAAEEWLEKSLRSMNIAYPAPEVLATLRERSGLIVGPGFYSFAHKSIAEFLVAETILQGDQRDDSGTRIDRFLLFEKRNDDRWNTVTFLWAGLAPIRDVELFIEECFKAKKWDLGYGVLYDQYNRTPIGMRRQLLLNAFADNPTFESRTWLERPASGPRASENPKKEGIPIFLLRSLVPGSYIDDLLSDAVADGTISWSDHGVAKAEMRDLLWFICSMDTADVEIWKACLASPCPANKSRLDWLYNVAENIVYRCADSKIALLFTAYREACPQAQGLVPLALMSAILRLSQFDEFTFGNSLSVTVNELLRILPNSDNGKTISKWLKQTRNWRLPTQQSGPEEPIYDLLAYFPKHMEALVEQGQLERNVTFERAMDFVTELKTRRDAITQTR